MCQWCMYTGRCVSRLTHCSSPERNKLIQYESQLQCLPNVKGLLLHQGEHHRISCIPTLPPTSFVAFRSPPCPQLSILLSTSQVLLGGSTDDGETFQQCYIPAHEMPSRLAKARTSK